MKSLVTITLGCLLGCSLLATGVATSAYAADESDKAAMERAEKRMESARKRLEEAAREVADLGAKVAIDRLPGEMVFLNRNPNRAMLGIGIGGSRETEVDDGVAVLSVSPGGPAANAGIKAGDVVIELNGKSLKRDKEDSPREKLLEGMGKLSPGDDVTLRYTREGKASIAKLKAERLPNESVARQFKFRVDPPGQRFELGDNDFDVLRAFGGGHGGAFGDIEMVPLTPKLAQYFGTDKGLLIVRAPEDKDSKLEDGDVLVDIDGRVPTNPGHALRILGSYQPGEKVTLNIWRQRKKAAIALTVPERATRAIRPSKTLRAPEPLRAPDAPAPRPPEARRMNTLALTLIA